MMSTYQDAILVLAHRKNALTLTVSNHQGVVLIIRDIEVLLICGDEFEIVPVTVVLLLRDLRAEETGGVRAGESRDEEREEGEETDHAAGREEREEGEETDHAAGSVTTGGGRDSPLSPTAHLTLQATCGSQDVVMTLLPT